MFAEFTSPHHTPHFHAYYQDDVADYSIDPVELMAGQLPGRQRRLVEAWASKKLGSGVSIDLLRTPTVYFCSYPTGFLKTAASRVR